MDFLPGEPQGASSSSKLSSTYGAGSAAPYTGRIGRPPTPAYTAFVEGCNKNMVSGTLRKITILTLYRMRSIAQRVMTLLVERHSVT